jgi:beta-ureidopropionase / N-carbamoyl-L-amino-acid hydrolase
MHCDPRRTVADLKQLRALTEDENGAQRVAWTDTWLKARDWFNRKLTGLPVEVHDDAAGNRWVTLVGESEKALLIGGHLDSVPNGGWLDGCLDTLSGLEVLRGFAKKYSGRPPLTVRLVDWADEEGARFGRSLLGSSAFAGKHSIDADRGKIDRDGVRLEDALQRCGVNIDHFPDARREQQHAAAYLELHIEQGPVLERLGLPLGAVLGTKGVERHMITFRGRESHAGSTPMQGRRDALIATAKLALEIRANACKYPDAVSTIGSVKTFPGFVTAIVGRTEAMLDQRDLDPGILAAMYQAAREASDRFAREEDCTVEWSRIWSIEAVPFHSTLIDFCAAAVQEVSGSVHRLPAGALHDATEVARAGIPTVMMFVQSLGGISHNKIEDTREEHLELAVEALDRLANTTADWILDGSKSGCRN